MRILLLHPEDDAEHGPWAGRAWDSIVDLGLGGSGMTYERWSRRFHCPVMTLKSFHQGFDNFRQVRALLELGCGPLRDEHGLDWWEIMSILPHGELETLVLLRSFTRTVEKDDAVSISRPGLHASLLQSLLNQPVDVFPSLHSSRKSGLGHYARVAKKLSISQLIDVFFDKYDAGYQMRGHFAPKRRRSHGPAVLLPTAYINVSRTGIAYANTFSDEKFLLVSTRRSGWMRDLPGNVEATWLSSYASLRDRRWENREMENRWQSLRKRLQANKEFEILNQLGYLEPFSRWIRNGLQVRDAWRNVLDSEDIQAVLCADDSNPYTRIPLLLGKALKLPNFACHHGALDGRYFFKRSYGDVILAKGKMEEDYLVQKCGVPQERVEVGAPRPPTTCAEPGDGRSQNAKPYILFFSEASEALGGRQEELYRDVLPPLAELALSTGRNLVVKLHPAESESERSNMVSRVLSAHQRSSTLIVSGTLTEDLFTKAWFGVTILSTVALECAIRGIPCFLCKWLEYSSYGYVDQFIQFGVGIGLDEPGQIPKIPELLTQPVVHIAVRENWWLPAAKKFLREAVNNPATRTSVRCDILMEERQG